MTFEENTKNQVEILGEARKAMVSALKKRKENRPELESLEIIDRGNKCGRGIETRLNDRRMYMWIECRYKDREYDINFFHSEIDNRSGNCHCQIGKVMFTKDYILNKQKPTSPNVIFRNTTTSNPDFLSDKDSTVLVFNSYKWHSPLEYLEDVTPDKLANGKWVTVDDILGGGLADEIADAFFDFILKDKSKLPATYWEYAALNGFGYEIYDNDAAKHYNSLAKKLNQLEDPKPENLEAILEKEVYPLGPEYSFLADIIDSF